MANETGVKSNWQRPLLLAVVGGMLLSAGQAKADEPLFGFAYTTDLLPKGNFELEQWSTTRVTKATAGDFWLQESRSEVEYGLTDKLQVALYGNYDSTAAFRNGPGGETVPAEQFSYDQPGASDHYGRSRFVGFSEETIYRILSPYRHKIGLAIYEEPTIGAGFIESETKVIIQKNFRDDRLVVALNLTYAPEWRHLLTDIGKKSWQEETDANIDLGATYRFRRNWSAGLEVLNEREFNSYNFTHESNSGYYLGPTIHYGGRHFFVTGTYVEQMPWATAHVDTLPGSLVDGRIIDNDFEKHRLRIKIGWYFGGEK